jgi:hypothetical protein
MRGGPWVLANHRSFRVENPGVEIRHCQYALIEWPPVKSRTGDCDAALVTAPAGAPNSVM